MGQIKQINVSCDKIDVDTFMRNIILECLVEVNNVPICLTHIIMI